jgi:hypothetical protein
MSQIDNKSPIDGVICTIVSGAPRSRVWRGRLFEGIEMPQTMKSSAHPSAQAGRRLSRAVPVFTRWADMALPAAIGRYPRIASSTASCSTTKSCQVRSSSPPAACMAPSSASKGLVGAGNLGQVGLGDRDDTNKSAVAVEANQCRLFQLQESRASRTGVRDTPASAAISATIRCGRSRDAHERCPPASDRAPA